VGAEAEPLELELLPVLSPEPELSPVLELELLPVLELELPELELPELELPELELEVPELEPLLDELDGVGVVPVCVEPGSTNATAPAIATLATPTPVVAARTLARPRFLAATASLSLSPFMVPSVGSSTPGSLPTTSEPPQTCPPVPISQKPIRSNELDFHDHEDFCAL
jgi:hypothetical protein